jgi:hypothetical protein
MMPSYVTAAGRPLSRDQRIRLAEQTQRLAKPKSKTQDPAVAARLREVAAMRQELKAAGVID